jgi:hypothetical protein
MTPRRFIRPKALPQKLMDPRGPKTKATAAITKGMMKWRTP